MFQLIIYVFYVFSWQCFFLVRIPKLAPAMLVKVEDSDMCHTIQVKFDDVRKNAPMFYNIIDEVLPISHDHHYPCLSRVKVVIDNLSSSVSLSLIFIVFLLILFKLI